MTHFHKNPNLELVSVSENSTLADALLSCIQSDNVEKKIKGARNNAFARVRLELVSQVRIHKTQEQVKGTPYNTSSVAGDFLLACEEAEKTVGMDGVESDTWKNYKSKLTQALKAGFDYEATPDAGLNALSKHIKEAKEAEEAAELAADKAAAAGTGASVTAGLADGSGDGEGESPAVPDSVTVGLAPEVKAGLEELIAHLSQIEPEKAVNMLKGWNKNAAMASAKAARLMKVA